MVFYLGIHELSAFSMKWFYVALLFVVASVLSGCNAKSALVWDTENVTGGLPPIQFTLTDDEGHVVDASHYAGKVTLLYFGYTHCPDVCPTTLATIHEALHKIGKRADDVRVLFVSVDPKRDTARALKSYASAFGPHFIGLTGTRPQLQAVTKRYHVTYSYYAPDSNGDYEVQHSSAIFVFGRHGNARLLMEYQKGATAMAHDLGQLISQG